jgi:hypothetical protein
MGECVASTMPCEARSAGPSVLLVARVATLPLMVKGPDWRLMVEVGLVVGLVAGWVVGLGAVLMLNDSYLDAGALKDAATVLLKGGREPLGILDRVQLGRPAPKLDGRGRPRDRRRGDGGRLHDCRGRGGGGGAGLVRREAGALAGLELLHAFVGMNG